MRVVGSDHSITVTDTTNAGKRGKMVDNFSVYDLGDLERKCSNELQRAILGAANYSEAREIAKKWIDAREWTSYRERQEKGVRVQHHGFEDITHNTAALEITIRWDNFIICDKTDLIEISQVLINCAHGTKRTRRESRPCDFGRL